tara:strand:+ start:649 stop:999 length:351 start_codon:yes stop_codon:yes gene_type:complete
MAKKLTKTQQEEVKKEVQERLHRRLYRKSKHHATAFGSEFKKQSSTALIAAFGFLIALVWRDLIVKLVKDNTSIALLDKYPYIAELWTAITVTLIAILGIALLARWAKSSNNDDKK